MEFKPTDIPQFISELGAGVVEEKLAYILSDVARSVLANQKMGEVSLSLKIKQVGSTDQVNVEHKIAYKKPKQRGAITEDDVQDTILYCNEGFNLTQFPENQTDMFNTNEEYKNVD